MTMRRGSRQRSATTPEREALRAVIHECEAFINWAGWSRPADRSERSITQMLQLKSKSRPELCCATTGGSLLLVK